MRALRSRWAADLLLPALVAVVEAAAVAPALYLAGGAAGPDGAARVPWPAALAVVGLAAFWSTRWLAALGTTVGVARLCSLLLWTVATLAWLGAQYEAPHGAAGMLPNAVTDLGQPLTSGAPLLVTVALALVAWRRGLGYGSEPDPFSPERLRLLVRTAFALLAAALTVAALGRYSFGRAALAAGRAAVPLAVICGLLAVAAGQLEQARRQAERRQGRAPGRGSWLAFAVSAAALVVLVSILVGGLLGDDVWRALYTPVVTALGWLSTALLDLLIALAVVLFVVIYYPLAWVVHHIFGGGAVTGSRQQPPRKPPDFSQLAEATQRNMPPELTFALRGLSVAVVVAVLVLVLLSALRRYRTFWRDEEVDEQRESLWSRDLALAQLRRAFARQRAPRVDRAAIDLTRLPASVREAYRYLGVLAQRRGVERGLAESASDFSRRLADSWPEVGGPIDDLTARYLRVRYGEEPDEQDRVAARAAWETVRSAEAAREARARETTRGRKPRDR